MTPATPAAPTSPTTPAPPTTPTTGTDVVTYKNDLLRTRQNTTESVLTTANVNATTFGLLRNLPVDGKVDAQPLYLSKLTVAGASHNVVYIATENDSVYALTRTAARAAVDGSLTAAGETTSDTTAATR